MQFLKIVETARLHPFRGENMADSKPSRFFTAYDVPARRQVRRDKKNKRELMFYQKAALVEIGRQYKRALKNKLVFSFYPSSRE